MKNAGQVPKSLHLLRPAVFYILLALDEGQRHGYGIKKEIEARTDGKIQIGLRTPYGSIKCMLKDGLIEESGVRPDPNLNNEQRRYYKLTDIGLRVLRTEVERLTRFVHLTQGKQLLFGPRCDLLILAV